MGDLREIDVDYNFFDDTPAGKDPDSHSPTLRRYHQRLWSKPLPDGRPFELHAGRSLSPYLVYQGDGTRIVFGSDTIATRHRRKLHHLYVQLSDEVNDAFLQRSYTICGFMIFPVSQGSLNQRRGTHPRIQDRWDLTLEAIRRFYEGGTSPLSAIMDRYADFFALFGSFSGYLDHFLLRDFVDERGAVRFLLPFDNFMSSALPSDLPTYERYRLDSLNLFEARRLRILDEIKRRSELP
ncbi:DUF6994 family protein [Paenarthrobacter ureafaciens]|uniref:DUF6994 family protein n=1 Tax=Paenarthrobacter ureafaciens TaxID=37931 RepID=UPI001917A0AD|nr:hypothetical protein [Paenarthrobacter ureafaciens]QQQ62644.1 hypothetical protein JHQ56_01865 [Paenarthrobacter ureafaciens]